MTVARDLVRIKLLLLWKPKDNDKINQCLPSIHSDHKVYWKSCYYLWTVCQMGSITVTYLSKTCKMILPGQIFFPVPMRACVISCFSCIRFCESQRTVARQAPLSMGFSRKNTGVGCHALLQGIFLTQGSNPCLSYLLHLEVGSLSRVPPGKLF